MEFESPADAWYVWLGVALVSVAIAAIAVGVPSEPPPDAAAAANAIDRAAGSDYEATSRYEHDAESVRIDGKRISMRNAGGAAHASIAYGSVVPVAGNGNLTAVLHGEDPTDVYSHVGSNWNRALHDDIADARGDVDDSDWRPATGELVVRTITFEYDGEERDATLVDA